MIENLIYPLEDDISFINFVKIYHIVVDAKYFFKEKIFDIFSSSILLNNHPNILDLL
jgi:hypothetical protein